MVPVSEAASRLRVSRGRVHHRIAAGSLRAEKVGSTWLVDVEGLQPARASRPMSQPMALALAMLAESQIPPVRPSESARLKEKLNRLRSMPTDEIPPLVSSWLADRARQIELEMHPDDLAELRRDDRLKLSGVSDPRAGLSSSVDLEAYVQPDDLEAIARDYFLDLHAHPARTNVVLRVAEVPMSEVPRLFSAADLFDRGGPRERRAGLELLEHA